MNRAQSIANALTTGEAQSIAARFLAAVERCDAWPDLSALVADLQGAVALAEDYAGVTPAWHTQANRVLSRCARCNQPRRPGARRICPRCRQHEHPPVPIRRRTACAAREA